MFAIVTTLWLLKFNKRSKFKYALEQSDDKDTAFILELMDKAISHMNTFGTQLFVYLDEGPYSIDNFIAERFIRPLVGVSGRTRYSSKLIRWRTSYLSIIPSAQYVRCGAC
jgi:hypothetical protein